jgi:hypothetical protein
MRFRGFLSALLILSVLAVSAATSSAQEPAPATAFDGGTATSTYAHDVAFLHRDQIHRYDDYRRPSADS